MPRSDDSSTRRPELSGAAAAAGEFDLGGYTRPCSTGSAAAQTWFDRGLVWAYGFNHEEAVRCFAAAAREDPSFALADWGVAYASGPNYNKAWEDFDADDLAESLAIAFAAARRAQEASASATPVERALVEAIAARYEAAAPPVDAARWNEDYAAAMRGVYRAHPDDLDVACLFADALMNLTPWELWDQVSGEPAAGAHTVEARAVLERAMASPGGAEHPGLLHLYIHLMEMSPTPEAALPAADGLRDLVPDAGHLQHMPSHIYVLCGDYGRTVDVNTEAMAADEKFRRRREEATFYTLYRAHDAHFKVYGAMFAGRSEAALEAAEALEAILPERLLRTASPPMADWLEGFLATRFHVLIRFGRWEEILAAPLPEDHDLYCATSATMHYAKGVAHAVLGEIETARAEQERFRAALARVPESRTVFNNTCRDTLTVAEAMLAGEIAYREGDFDRAFAELRRSIDLDDGLPYDEPWGWMQPTRHAYGALLLEQGRTEEALAVYRADLGLDDTLPRACRHPNNVWSLHGYHECLVATGKAEEAAAIESQLAVAAAGADIPIESSCFCRGAAPCRHCD
jgi:tetratricopeptide (TPR) repeat protein